MPNLREEMAGMIGRCLLVMEVGIDSCFSSLREATLQTVVVVAKVMTVTRWLLSPSQC